MGLQATKSIMTEEMELKYLEMKRGRRSSSRDQGQRSRSKQVQRGGRYVASKSVAKS